MFSTEEYQVLKEFARKLLAAKPEAPAPGNHPGTPEAAITQRCPACEFAFDPDGHRPCLACGGTRFIPSPGKPDEAPLSEHERIINLLGQLAARDARIAELERRILRALGCLSEELK